MIRYVILTILLAAAAAGAVAWALSYRGVDPTDPSSLEKLDDFRRRLPVRASPKGWAAEWSVGPRRYLSLVGFRGRLALAHFVEVDGSVSGATRRKRWAGLSSESFVQRPSGGRPGAAGKGGLSEKERRQAAAYAVRRVSLPLWIPVALSAAYPVVSIPRAVLRRRRRRRHGRCVHCGYNLKGAPGGRCSECGTIIPPDRLRATISETPARPRDGGRSRRR